MKLAEWIKKSTTGELRALAQAVDCHPQYLYGVAKDGCSTKLAKKIEKEVPKITPKRVVTKAEVKPDVWDN